MFSKINYANVNQCVMCDMAVINKVILIKTF